MALGVNVVEMGHLSEVRKGVSVALIGSDFVEVTQGTVTFVFEHVFSIDHDEHDDPGSEPPRCSLGCKHTGSDTSDTQILLVLGFHNANAYGDKALDDQGQRQTNREDRFNECDDGEQKQAVLVPQRKDPAPPKTDFMARCPCL